MSTEKADSDRNVTGEQSDLVTDSLNANESELKQSQNNTQNLNDGNSSATNSAQLPAANDVASLNTDAFNALVSYVQEDLSSVVEDYKLLERMNRVTIAKYAEMKEVSTTVHIEMVKINEKYRSLVPCLEQIDQIEENVASLEEVAHRLDAYSKRLEAKFKQLEKR